MAILVSRVSRGTRMDQIYIPKVRAPGFEVGETVFVEPALQKATKKVKLHYYHVGYLESIKVGVIEKIFEYFEQNAEAENILVAGSFLERGFTFEDIDILVIGDKKFDAVKVAEYFREGLGLKTQIIAMGNKALLKGISTDPLFEMLVSKFVAKRRVIFGVAREIRYKLLDLHLLKSELLIINFYSLTGREKYKFVRNLTAIALFLDGKKISADSVDNEINRYFGKDAVKSIRENLVDKSFLAKYKKFYDRVFKRILAGIKNGSEQKQAA